MNYYLVTAKCGHVGKTHYIPIKFAVMAESGEEAARIARRIPRVKHHHKDAIIGCQKVSKEEFDEQNRINKNDPYLKATSKKEQKEMVENLVERLLLDNHPEEMVKHYRKASRPNLMYQNLKYQSNDQIRDYEYILS